MVAVIRECDKYAHDVGNIMSKNNAKMMTSGDKKRDKYGYMSVTRRR